MKVKLGPPVEFDNDGDLSLPNFNATCVDIVGMNQRGGLTHLIQNPDIVPAYLLTIKYHNKTGAKASLLASLLERSFYMISDGECYMWLMPYDRDAWQFGPPGPMPRAAKNLILLAIENYISKISH